MAKAGKRGKAARGHLPRDGGSDAAATDAHKDAAADATDAETDAGPPACTQRLHARRAPLRERRLAELRARHERMYRLGLHHELRRRHQLLVVDRSLRLSSRAGRLLGRRDSL